MVMGWACPYIGGSGVATRDVEALQGETIRAQSVKPDSVCVYFREREREL